MLAELRPSLLELAKSSYAHFTVTKLIALAPKADVQGALPVPCRACAGGLRAARCCRQRSQEGAVGCHGRPDRGPVSLPRSWGARFQDGSVNRVALCLCWLGNQPQLASVAYVQTVVMGVPAHTQETCWCANMRPACVSAQLPKMSHTHTALSFQPGPRP